MKKQIQTKKRQNRSKKINRSKKHNKKSIKRGGRNIPDPFQENKCYSFKIGDQKYRVQYTGHNDDHYNFIEQNYGEPVSILKNQIDKNTVAPIEC
jgi:hypothetical protein